MTPTVPSDVEAIFTAVVEIGLPSERSAYLDIKCRDDAQLRARVEALLSAHQQAEGFLDPVQVTGSATESSVDPEQPGTLIGRYQLKEIIGEGGFGDVWLAEQQEPVQRQVALKIIKLGMDTKQVVARFEAERQALALMEHPHIAKVLDAGATEAGRPYFVMELVRGIPITEHCDQHQLSIPERLELFMKVCGAVQHAHQKGIIHRDLKPTNILVTLHDGQPVPKVIDFGIAKAIQQRLTEHSVYTAYHQFIGTPEYMSPEQAEHSDQDVDTRSDIYSLGVLLYELLVGTTPFDREQLKSHGYSEICRVIRESDPATPSRRLSGLGKTLADVARRRQITPVDLGKRLRGDLDWIVMKALEKDRTRRYENASALSQDVERYFQDEPVLARPPSTAYRTKKLLRKHRGPVAALSAVFVALIVGLLMSEYQRHLADIARKEADENASLAEAVTEQKEQLLYAANMNAAFGAWEAGALRRVDDLLKRQEPAIGGPDRRGFEWHYLRNLFDRTIAVPRLEHDQPLWDMVLSADGQAVVTASSEALYVWDYASRKLLQSIERHGHDKTTLALSPDSQMLASGGRDHNVKLWDAATGELHQTLEQVEYVAAIAFAPDGRLLAVGGGGSTSGYLQIWDLSSGKMIHALTGHEAVVEDLAWSDPSGILVSGSEDRTVKVWDTTTFQPRYTFSQHRNRVLTVAISPGGQSVASGGHGGGVKVWEPTRGGETVNLVRRGGRVTRLAFSPDGHLLAAAYSDNAVAIWDLATASLRTLISGHLGEIHEAAGIRGLCFSVDGSTVLSAGDRTVRFWRVDERESGPSQAGHDDWLSLIAVCGTRNSVAFASAEITNETRAAELVLWDLDNRTPQLFSSLESRSFRALASSPNGKILVTGEAGGEVRLWDASNGEFLEVLGKHSHPVWAVVISPDGRTVASCDWGYTGLATPDFGNWAATLNVWDRTTEELFQSVRLPRFKAFDIRFSPDGEFLAVGGGRWDAGVVKLIRVTNGSEELSVATPRMVFDVTFSPSGEALVSADHAGVITFCDLPTGEVRTLTQPGHQSLNSVAVSPDGKTLATGSRDGILTLWNVSSADTLTEFQLGLQIFSVQFLPDGKTLAAACGDRSVHLWRTDGTKDVLRSPQE